VKKIRQNGGQGCHDFGFYSKVEIIKRQTKLKFATTCREQQNSKHSFKEMASPNTAISIKVVGF